MSPTSSSYEQATREQSRRQADCLRRDLTVLIVDHLRRREGMFEAAEAVKEGLGWDVDEYRHGCQMTIDKFLDCMCLALLDYGSATLHCKI